MFQDLFDFEKWAPRSSQAWRLGQDPSVNRSNTGPGNPSSKQVPKSVSMSQEDVEVLNQRLAEARSMDDDFGEQRPLVANEETYFTDSSDSELADALEARIARLASPTESSSTGRELIELIFSKYGKEHDVSFVRRDIPGKTLVSLNIYHAHLGQRSFPMTKEDYEEKMDGVAITLNAWGQWHTVETFLKEPVAPRRGLPSRPIVGNAVSIKLELTKEQIQEWFGR